MPLLWHVTEQITGDESVTPFHRRSAAKAAPTRRSASDWVWGLPEPQALLAPQESNDKSELAEASPSA